MRIGRNISIGKLLLILLLLSDVCFFTIPGISNAFSAVATYHTKLLCGLITLLMLIVVIGTEHWKIHFNTNSEEFFIIIYFFIVMLVFVISMIRYNAVSFSFLREYFYYFVPPLLIFTLNKNIKRNESFYDFLFNLVIVIGMLYAVYACISYFMYESTGLVIMNSDIQLYAERNDHLRLVRVTDFVSLSTAFAMIKFFVTKRRRKLLYLACTVLGIFTLFVVGQTRIYEIAIVALGIVILFKSQRRAINKLAIFILFVIVVYLLSASIQEFLESFSTVYAFSTENRLGAYGYFMGHFFDNVIFGLGFPPSSTYFDLIHGASGLFSLTDCGYIGFLSVFGLIGALFLVAFLVFFVTNFIKSFKFKGLNEAALVTSGLTLYMLVTNWSVSIVDAQRCVVGSIMIAVLLKNIRDMNYKQTMNPNVVEH